MQPVGFAHNENSVRVLTKIEKRDNGKNLNLTKEVLNGILNHGGLGNKGTLPFTLEGQIVRISDKIAYVQHDIDDSIRAGALRAEELPKDCLEVLGNSHSKRINTLVQDVVYTTLKLMKDNKEKSDIRIAMSQEVEEALVKLRTFMFQAIYNGKLCLMERERAVFVVEYLFQYFLKHPEKMPSFYQEIAREEDLKRAVCDYISGMTDVYCVELFKDLALPKSFVVNNILDSESFL
jgi:dGTPase